MKTYISKSESDTLKFAEKFARTLRGGEVVALIGDLGSGKTTFVRGLARAFGIREPVRSPTFTLMHVHRVRQPLTANRRQQRAVVGERYAIRAIVHIDAYRLKNARELEEIGIGEYLGKPDTVVLIEWADRVAGLLKKQKRVYTLRFSHGKNLVERRIVQNFKDTAREKRARSTHGNQRPRFASSQ